MMRLQGKAAIVTGAAAGQGKRVAAAYAAEGARVFLVDLDALQVAAAAEELRSLGGDTVSFAGDVAFEEPWVDLMTLVDESCGQLDVLYNNAALFSPSDGPVSQLDASIWDRVMAVNARGVFLGCKHGAPLMERSGGGSIINIASIRATLGSSKAHDAYAASKGAVVALTMSMAVHLAPAQIRVNAISPGTILTAMAPLPDEAAIAQRLARYPLGRFGTTDDIVGAAVLLASDESSWITGVNLAIDGGTSAYYV
jgi:NAD(P)-dependent dehydrogenase (short-subunit alcohol dehydrogenase family)